ncbi:hypothetical protein HMSSN139_31920 [Paenibacillus sp. HMSSN-139]|nr:hypothetical protein HMSSN139_31920 [Paenibacillus sp. HMSSN-139]
MKTKSHPLLGVHSLVMMIFIYVPILFIVAYSFNSSRLAADWSGFTFDWYVSLFENRHVMEALANSLTVAIVSTVISTVLGTLAALAMRKLGRAIKREWAVYCICRSLSRISSWACPCWCCLINCTCRSAK